MQCKNCNSTQFEVKYLESMRVTPFGKYAEFEKLFICENCGKKYTLNVPYLKSKSDNFMVEMFKNAMS